MFRVVVNFLKSNMHSKQEFRAIIDNIVNGHNVDQLKILPFLNQTSVNDRGYVNSELANAFYRAGKYELAKVFIKRVELFTGFHPDVHNLSVSIYRKLNDLAAIREGYKRVGMQKATANKISEAIHFFNKSQNTYAEFDNVDKYEYDHDILK